MKRLLVSVLSCAGVLFALAAILWRMNFLDEDAISETTPTTASAPSTGTPLSPPSVDPAQIARGEYLARAGNCMACHTLRGGAEYAGGRGIDTPFGTVYSSNLTPDARTGIGRWSSAHFWRAMHNGRSKDGRLLYPAFPYTNYTLVSRADSDAIYSYLQSRPAVEQANRPHALRFPYNTQPALAVWRALYFKPGGFAPDSAESAEWNRGAYLTRGLGHCSACHTTRNSWGAPNNQRDLAGGLMPMQNWYAPALTAADEAGLAHWDTRDIVRLLKTGTASDAGTNGPMAEVVLHSTQYLNQADLNAMALFLKKLPHTTPPRDTAAAAPASAKPAPPSPQAMLGAKLYEQHCIACHGDAGQGVPGAYPPLAGNRAVTMASTANLVQIVLKGGFAPATAENPRPFGMPPYMLVLSDSEVAAVLSHIRASWGNRAEAVSEFDVNRLRSNPNQ